MAFDFHTSKYPSSATNDTITVGHDGDDASIKTGSGKLLLSASSEIIHASGAIDIGLNVENKAYSLRAKNTTLIFSSSAQGSFTYISGNLSVEQDFLVKGNSVLSGNLVVGGQVYDLNSNLILSSSAVSFVAASASLEFPNTDKAFHVRAVNSHLIFSSSAGSVVAFSASQDFTNADKQYHIRAANSHLILSSSAGSTVTLSAALDLLEPVSTIKNYSIRSTITDLILSSSATSVVSISASLRMISQTARNYHIAGSNDLILSASTGQITISGGIDIENNGRSYDLKKKSGHLIFTSSVGSVVAMSASIEVPNADKAYHLRAVNTHLILTSSVGSIVFVSGALTASAGIRSNAGMYSVDNLTGRLQASNTVVATPYITLNNGSDFLFGVTGGTFKKMGLLADIDIQWKSTSTGDATSRSSDDTGLGRLSAGVLYVSGTTASPDGGLTALKGVLILSSSVGSLIVASSSIDILNTTKTYHLRAVNSDLTLSGTAIIASSSMFATATGSGPALMDRQPTQSVATLIPYRGSSNGLITGIGSNGNSSSPSIDFITNGGNKWSISSGGELGSNSSTVGLNVRGRIYNDIQHMTLSSSVGSVVRVSASLGLHKATSTALPSGDVTLSGTILWVDDLRQFAIYGPLGWVRVTTGSVVG